MARCEMKADHPAKMALWIIPNGSNKATQNCKNNGRTPA
jgi:hypothetical protein